MLHNPTVAINGRSRIKWGPLGGCNPMGGRSPRDRSLSWIQQGNQVGDVLGVAGSVSEVSYKGQPLLLPHWSLSPRSGGSHLASPGTGGLKMVDVVHKSEGLQSLSRCWGWCLNHTPVCLLSDSTWFPRLPPKPTYKYKKYKSVLKLLASKKCCKQAVKHHETMLL